MLWGALREASLMIFLLFNLSFWLSYYILWFLDYFLKIKNSKKNCESEGSKSLIINKNTNIIFINFLVSRDETLFIQIANNQILYSNFK